MKEILEYPGYFVDRNGNVYSLHNKGKENIQINGKYYYKMKGIIDKKGYKKYLLSSPKKKKAEFAHRLVAITFIPNPNKYPIVNHKDFNPLNNNVDNLEWCTYKYNSQYTWKSGKRQKQKEVFVYKNDVEINRFTNLTVAAEFVVKMVNNETSIRNVSHRMQYKNYKLIIPENGDTLEYSNTAKHHFTTKEQSISCVLYEGTTFIKSFASKQDALKYCKSNYGFSDDLRRKNYSIKHNLLLKYDYDNKSVEDIWKEIKSKPSQKGKTSKIKGFLYKDNLLIGQFNSVNQANIFCKSNFNCSLSPQFPYCNISNKLLFVTKNEDLDNLNNIWNDIIKKANYRSKKVW